MQNAENRMIFELSGNFCSAMCADFGTKLDIFVVKKQRRQNIAVKTLIYTDGKLTMICVRMGELNKRTSDFWNFL